MVVFDTEALLIFYLGEEGADVVEDLLVKNDNLVVGRDDDFEKVNVPKIKVR